MRDHHNRTFSRYLFISLSLFALLGSQIVKADQVKVNWVNIAPDLEVSEIGVPALFSSQLLLVRTSLKDFKFSVGLASDFGSQVTTAKGIAEKSGASLAINANFFDPDLKALGLVVNRGIQRNKIHKGGRVLTGIFELNSSGLGIYHRDGYSSSRAIEAIQAGPRLIADGQSISGLETNDGVTRRSGICIDQKGRVIIFCSVSNLGGISLGNLQVILSDPGIGCKDALNLDGGGSAQLFIKNRGSAPGANSYERFFPGMDEVPVFLLLKPK